MFPWTIFLLLGLLTTPANAQGPMDRLQKLAADGKIDESAAVKASSEITIHESPENVWHLLTDRWRPRRRRAPAGPPVPGSVSTTGGPATVAAW